MENTLCIVIPCYNEEKKLALKAYQNFFQSNPEVIICFVNDGSTDSTLQKLESLQAKFSDRISIISNPKNLGKAEAVRNGMLFSNKNLEFKHIAYLDADLSTSLEECKSLTTYLKDDVNFVFGSRIMKIGSVIERRQHRFLIGRVIATVISSVLQLKVYDTQCGCKVFTKELSKQVFKEPFLSKWLFDVEIFHRIIDYYGRENVLNNMLEIPLKRWVDVGDSKVKTTYFIRLWVDIYRIHNRYNKPTKTLSESSKTSH